MEPPRLVMIVLFDGCRLLDFSGPAAVFSCANELHTFPLYELHLVSTDGGQVRTDSGIEVQTAALSDFSQQKIDTIMVAGGDKQAILLQNNNQPLLDWLNKQTNSVRRMCSVCSGAFILAKAGLLKERRATTHWSACHILDKHYADTVVDDEALFVIDGHIWTSAGATTGIDMSLVLVEQDAGSALANGVAQELVLYARRPGHQTQFSPLLQAQRNADEPFKELLQWMQHNLIARLDVESLADRVNMSQRTFHRRFTESIGMTPANFVLNLRLDQARELVGRGEKLKAIVKTSGFSSVTHLSTAFQRRFGISISVFRTLHRVDSL
jgi:transcriptional regulator GlxA family with amidase domain